MAFYAGVHWGTPERSWRPEVSSIATSSANRFAVGFIQTPNYLATRQQHGARLHGLEKTGLLIPTLEGKTNLVFMSV